MTFLTAGFEVWREWRELYRLAVDNWRRRRAERMDPRDLSGDALVAAATRAWK